MSGDAFDATHAAGRAAVLDGTHDVEAPPSVTGRWGPSVVAFPSGELAATLDALTSEAVTIAGPRHWRSGADGRAHVTVRAIAKRAERPPSPDRIHRYVAAMDRALTAVGSFRLDFDGLALSNNGLLAIATSPDGRADELRRRLAIELGDDGGFEREAYDEPRTRWWSSLVHFAGPVVDAPGLVEWVDARRATAIGSETFDALALCRWNHDGTAMAPLELGYVG
jgi:hypothetical protein